MTKWIFAAILIASASSASAQNYGFGTGSNSRSHSTSGYTGSTGTYVPPSHATNPNNTQTDNYTTRGNVNPYTGAVGTRTPRY
jgi:hypothetical protein